LGEKTLAQVGWMLQLVYSVYNLRPTWFIDKPGWGINNIPAFIYRFIQPDAVCSADRVDAEEAFISALTWAAALVASADK
jgi:hypothetical protein